MQPAYPWSNFNGLVAVEIMACMSNYILCIYVDMITYSCDKSSSSAEFHRLNLGGQGIVLPFNV